ncbi:MAG: hypothetical protein Q8N88_02215, partial [Nanoarchaeota archaeon]|nr:hypothetical protein [Nanoarchaeota archaeon]
KMSIEKKEIFLNKRLIGFSTGFLNLGSSPNLREAITICKNIGCNAIELNCSIEELNKLDKSFLDDFKFISFHAPGMTGGKESFKLLSAIEGFHKKFNFNAIVIHPDEIKNWEIFNSFDLPISLENMDNHKKTGRFLRDMKKFASLGNFKITIDINHCFVNDHSLKLADDLFREFQEKISHFHLSGHFKLHDPLVLTNQKKIIDFVSDKKLPIIIESMCINEEEARVEFNFIETILYPQKFNKTESRNTKIDFVDS